ncbi:MULTISPECIES: DUF6204 family protein [Amycolatopsis]|uniref:DUF6204 family protein n=1 Tax=Amycolatopsis tucumanensis TaxID=401106 RepID=A0ABP7IL28_9PSEU|nr:DUF6204 family protein [Amycolatopsis tucumanensis]MCF6427406.1 DUF6204 family protein [Amycolatopsis tucumanensis]
MSRTYRVTVRGRFENLTAPQRERLLEEQEAHDVFASRFTPEGTFLYTPQLIGYQFRYLLHVEEDSPEDADLAAQLEAQELAEAGMRARGLQGRIVEISLTCLDDVKIRKSRR